MRAEQKQGAMATKSARTTKAFVIRVIVVLTMLFISGPTAGYFLIYQPLREAVETNLISNFAQLGAVKHNSFQEASRQYRYRSQLVSDRAMIRRAMESYLDGQMDYEELQAYAEERYEDFVSTFPNLLHTTRYIGDEPLVFYFGEGNEGLSPPLPPSHQANQQHTAIQYHGGRVTLFITSPVRATTGEVIGHDFLAFDVSEALQMLSDESSWVTLLPADAFGAKAPLFTENSASVHLVDDQYSWTVPLSDSLLFVSTTEASSLLASLHKIRTHIIVNFLLLYVALILIIVFYIVRFAQRELLMRDIDQGVFTKAISDAKIDYLTAIGNRRSAEELLGDCFERFAQAGMQPPIILFDIDGFKAINDTFGHAVGDEVLIAITQAVLTLIGDRGHLFRWGGDEFLLIAADHPIADSEIVARAVLEAVGQVIITVEEGKIHPTISMGISAFSGEDYSYLDAVARADRKMYQAKSGMGNSYELAL